MPRPSDSDDPVYTIVVPTYNRLDVLPEVLDAIEAQRDAPPYELVIVDDGSTDDTPAFLEQRSFTVPATVHRQPNSGPAKARNHGARAASGRWVAFLGDDTVPHSGWLAAHHAAQTGSTARRARGEGLDVGVIGYTQWHPRMRLDPFLRYINEYGLQFGYALIDDPDQVPFNFLYTSNLSLPREALLAEPFDESFPYAAWEDIELSYRLHERGFQLLYERAAVVDHDHPTDLARFSQRQQNAGYCAVVFHRLHPELGPFLGLGEEGPPPLPGRLGQRLREGLARLLQSSTRIGVSLSAPRLWEETLRYHYIVGLQRGWSALQPGSDRNRRGRTATRPNGPTE